MWNNRFVESVQVIADQDKGVSGRGEFYDSVGAVRDMAENHLLQLLCLVAMDRPEGGGAGPRAKARVRVLKAARPMSEGDVALGQYRGYSDAKGVRQGSRTPTFVAARILIDSPRWRGVPFYIRTGRRLARSATEVAVIFRRQSGGETGSTSGFVRFRIDPDLPTSVVRGGSAREWRDPSRANPRGEYERVLSGALRGDRRMFVDGRFNEAAWRIFDPLVREGVGGAPELYEPGSRGPASADRLPAQDGRSWFDGRGARGR